MSALNVLPGTVAQIAASAAAATGEVRLDCNGVSLVARLTRKSIADLALAPGTPVFAVVKSVAFDGAPYGGSER